MNQPVPRPMTPPPALPSYSARVVNRSFLLARRFTVVAALMFWQGGFTFYAAIVVPIGGDVLGSAAEQARVTRLVAQNLNLVGVICLILFAWDIAVARSRRTLRWTRWATWLGIAVCLVVLMVVYPYLDEMFHGGDAFLEPGDRAAFRPWHRLYLWVSSAQWGCAILFALLSLESWRQEDHDRPPARPRDAKISAS